MTPFPKCTFEMDVKVIVLLQLFNKSKLSSGIKTLLVPKFYPFIVKLTKLGLLPCPRTQQANLPRLAGIPTFKIFWFDSTRK